MLILNKVRLVNWHFFHNAVVDLGETTLLAGDNGSGKSTIIDAIQYVLVANIQKIQFNAAASQQKTQRNLESYCLCKIGAMELDFYRETTITHVILEFKLRDQTFLAGAMVEAGRNREIKESFWIMEKGKLEDAPVFSGEQITQPRTFREKIKAIGGFVSSGKQDYSARLTNLLKVYRRNTKFNPYFAALIRSVSFTPFTSIDRFVCDYILEERHLDIGPMKENLINYREAEKEALGIEEKIRELSKVEEIQNEVLRHQKNILNQEYLHNRLKIEIDEKEKEKLLSDTKEKESELQREIESRSRMDQLRIRLEARKDELSVALKNNETYRLHEKYKQDKETIGAQLKNEQKRVALFNLLKKESEDLLGRRLDKSPEQEIEKLEKKIDNNKEQKINMERELGEKKLIALDLRKEKNDLKQGIIRYPESTLKLKKALEDRGIEAWIFADRLEVTNPKWQDAVEGWLNTQRFNILVKESDFQKAIEIYNNLPKRVGGVGIPNLHKMKDIEVSPGSLAEIVKGDSPLSRRYAAYLLGEVIMTDLKKLKEYSRSITITCMRYSSKTASRIKEEVYSRWFIGKAAKEKRLKQIDKELELLDKTILDIGVNLKETGREEEILKQVYRKVFDLKGLIDAFEKEKELSLELKQVEKLLSQMDIQEFIELEKEMNNIKKQLDQLRIDRDELLGKINRLDYFITANKKNIEVLKEEIKGASEKFDLFLKANGEYLEDFESYYKSRTKKGNDLEGLKKIQQNYEGAMKGIISLLLTTRENLKQLKILYNNKYNTYMTIDDENSRPFIKTLQKYKDTELPAYIEKIEKARNEAERQFKEHFVSRLNEYLEDATESFKELNFSLKNIPFGEDQYSFILEARNDKKMLLELIKETAQIRDYDVPLFEQFIDEEQRRSIETLFQKVLDNDLNSEAVIELCDYRRYFTYDIRIKHTKTMDSVGKPHVSSLSRVLREKSGGETQTPYYVAIAASFYRFYKDEPEAIRLVLFDEAFNKMDDDRIGNMIDFFKRLGMQVVTAVPTEKIETIAPYMSRINLIIRNNYRAHIRDYTILSEKEAEN